MIEKVLMFCTHISDWTANSVGYTRQLEREEMATLMEMEEKKRHGLIQCKGDDGSWSGQKINGKSREKKMN